jgi:acetyl esterase/lipase
MKTIVCTSLLLILGLANVSTAAAPRTTLDVWPGAAPGETGTVGEEKYMPSKPEARPVKRLTNVTRPTLTVYQPDAAKATGTAVVVCPGGGYAILAMDLEGEEVAGWLNSIGVTAFVLKYRVPRREGTPRDVPPVQPLMDAQRAVSLVRSGAADLKIAPDRIGILGFSAGGHLAASTATNSQHRQYAPQDAVDQVSCRPDFAVLVYPAYLVQKGGALSPEIRVDAKTPPCFFAHCGDDRISSENSIGMYLALKRSSVPAEMHIYASGGHGFGLRPTGKAAPTWPKRCEEWLRDSGLLKADKR